MDANTMKIDTIDTIDMKNHKFEEKYPQIDTDEPGGF